MIFDLENGIDDIGDILFNKFEANDNNCMLNIHTFLCRLKDKTDVNDEICWGNYRPSFYHK